MDKATLIKTLLDIDEEAYLTLGKPSTLHKIIIVGGSAFMLRDLTNRPTTHDIDILAASVQIRNIIARYPAVNGAVAAHADSLPYNFEDRLVALSLETKVINALTPSLEDLVVMKLYAWRPNDIEDLTSSTVLQALDWDMLDYLVYDENEAKASALVPRRYREMVHMYELFKEEYQR